MKKLVLACTTLAMAFFAAEANAKGSSCPGFVDGQASQFDADEFYANRAISIVRAALKNDAASLDSLVAAQAKFAISRGDYTTSARDSGVRGIMEMVRDVKPTGFQTSTTLRGPLSVLIEKCAWTAQVTLRTAKSDEGVVVKFDFVDGLLVQGTGHQVKLAEGDLH
jgi:hypothetical protein